MSDNGMNAPSLEMRDFLAAFDLDRADIKDISIYHENNGLTINITLNIKEHKCLYAIPQQQRSKDIKIKA
jgi:hypothetical protein